MAGETAGLTGEQHGWIEKIWIKANSDATAEVDKDELSRLMFTWGDPNGVLAALFLQWGEYRGVYGIPLANWREFFKMQAALDQEGTVEFLEFFANALRLISKKKGTVDLSRYITEEEFDTFYDRQARNQRKHENWKAGAKMDLLTQELENLQAAPTISVRSKWMARHNRPLDKRLYQVIQDHDLLMRNVGQAVLEAEEAYGDEDAPWRQEEEAPDRTAKQIEQNARDLMMRGVLMKERRQMAQRTQQKEQMGEMLDRPQISEKTKRLATAKQMSQSGNKAGQTVALHDRLSRTQTQSSGKKVSQKMAQSRPTSARAGASPTRQSPGSSTVATNARPRVNSAAVLASERMYRQGLRKKQQREEHMINELRARGCTDPAALLQATSGQAVFRCWQR